MPVNDRRPSVRMVFTRDYVLQAPKPCSADRHAFTYWCRRAKQYLDHTTAHCVILVNRGTSSQVRYQPASDEVMLVPSTAGRYGKSSISRLGSGVLPI